MSDVKAGGAYIELGLEGLREVSDGLSEVAGQLSDLGEHITGIGTKMMGVGAAIAAPLAAGVKMFSDYGKQIGNMSQQTGISVQALAGLGYAAQKSGVSIEAIGSATKHMQRNIADGSKEANEAFTKLGLSSEKLKGMSAEEQFGAIADALSGVSDQAVKTDLSMKLLGRSGPELAPLMNQGSAGIKNLSNEAKQLGLVLSDAQTKSGRQLAESFERLEGAVKGVALQIGAALAPVLKPVVDGLVDMAIAAKDWIQTNPEFITGLAKIATTLVVVGAAFVAIGTTLMALMSPVVMITAGLMAIGMAALAVTDTLGLTDTGFGDLFNSIRIGGTGLGTWLGAFWIFVEKGFNNLVTGVSYVAELWWDSWQYVITKITNAFAAMIQGVLSGLTDLISAFNAVAPKAMQIDVSFLKNAGNAIQGFRDQGNKEIDQRASNRDNILLRGERRNAALDKQQQDLFKKDPQDNTTGITADTSRAKAALSKIGDNIWGALSGAAKGLVGKFDVPHHDFDQGPEGDTKSLYVAADKTHGSVLGTFNSSAVGQLGAGPNIGERIAKAAEKTAQNTDPRTQATLRDP